jgi:hypothetical protein
MYLSDLDRNPQLTHETDLIIWARAKFAFSLHVIVNEGLGPYRSLVAVYSGEKIIELSL